MFNSSIHYHDTTLYCDEIPVAEIIAKCNTPTYIYSLPRIIQNYRHIKSSFADLDAHIHFSAKANANHTILKTLVSNGAGIDAVSGGEIYRALKAGVKPENIVFAGVGKTYEELRFAIEQCVGWINVENVAECQYINDIADQLKRQPVKIALRLNPDVSANTHPYIATGHGGAKFGLTAETVREILAEQSRYPNLNFAGIHVHIGSQLHDTDATKQAIQKAIDLIAPYPNIKTINIGGGLPVAYQPDDKLPDFKEFANTLSPLLEDYIVILEPGRSIVADAGILVTKVLYIKQHGGETFTIVDASMAELIRPSLYQAYHEIIPINQASNEEPQFPVTIVGPVCETADVLGRNRMLPSLNEGDLLAIMTTGAYGMVMASNYNSRPRPSEVIIDSDGQHWQLSRKRETWESMLADEVFE